MNKKDVMTALEAHGTEQNRKVYGRHGVQGPMFGVSYANLGKLQRKIKTDHKLALELWDSGNHDARVLATKVIDPRQLRSGELDSMVKEVGDHVICAAFSEVAAGSPCAVAKMEKWMQAQDEWVSAVGWHMLATLASRGHLFTTPCLEKYIRTIEKEIHGAKNRTRYAMNGALISIGVRDDHLEKKATEAAERIGVVEVDHGETGCKTPDAVPYIEKAGAHRREQLSMQNAARSGKKSRKKSTGKTTGKTAKKTTRKAGKRPTTRGSAGKQAGRETARKTSRRSTTQSTAGKKSGKKPGRTTRPPR